jgi:Trk K+ transport system NAD-binding subunit
VPSKVRIVAITRNGKALVGDPSLPVQAEDIITLAVRVDAFRIISSYLGVL